MASKGMSQLYVKKLRLWKEMVNYGDFMRGSIVTLKRPCTYAGCQRCQTGENHPTTYYSISRKNKTELIYLPKPIQPQVKILIAKYRKLLLVIDQLSEISIQIIRTRIKEGSKK